MRTPSRRMTLAGVPSHVNNKNRRTSMGPNNASGPLAQQQHQHQPSNGANHVPRIPKGRVSMIPRVGRENAMPNISDSPSNDGHLGPSKEEAQSSAGGSTVMVPIAASRRRSVVTLDRRQSLLPPPPSNLKVADPRPLTDKAFQQTSIHQLLAFLLDHGYPYPVTAKSLSRPSLKDFQNICTFLLRLVDPAFQRSGTPMKFEDEVVLNFKMVGYPFIISKTALVAPVSPHSWSSLLAAFTWLMEHIQCHQEHVPTDTVGELLFSEETKAYDSIQDLEMAANKAFFAYLGEAYIAFIEGDAHATQKLEVGLADRFERDDNHLLHELNCSTDLNAAINARISALQQEWEALPALEKKREDYATDLEQFQDLMYQMTEHKSALQIKVTDRTAEFEKINKDLHSIGKRVADLKHKVGTQKLTVQDVYKLDSELKGVNEALDRTLATKAKHQQALMEIEKEMLDGEHRLDAAVAEYNSILSCFLQVPELAARATAVKAKLDKTQLDTGDQSKVLGVKVQSAVIPSLSDANAFYLGRFGRTKTLYQDELDASEALKGRSKHAAGRLLIAKDKTLKAENNVQSEHQAYDTKLQIRKRELESLENKIAVRRNLVAVEEENVAFERQLAELQALDVEQREQQEQFKVALVRDIETACALMTQHENYVRQKLAELNQYWKDKIELQPIAIQVPDNLPAFDNSCPP